MLEDINSGSVADNDRFASNGADTAIIDGDTVTAVDAYTAFDWDPPKNLGVRMELDDTYYVEQLVLYSGLADYPDTLKVYASDKLVDLYADINLVEADVVRGGEALEQATKEDHI